jgi:phosphomannomutase
LPDDGEEHLPIYDQGHEETHQQHFEMSAPCQAVTQCGVPTTPGIGFATETFAAPGFVAVATGPNQPPPLGYGFENPTATANGESTVSQEEAEQAAWQSALSQAQAGFIPPVDEEEWWQSVDPISVDFAASYESTLADVEPIY